MIESPAPRWERVGRPAKAESPAAVAEPQTPVPHVRYWSPDKSFRFQHEAPASFRVPTWAVGLLFAALALGGYRWLAAERVDKEFLRARKVVADYERGKDPETINYADPAYDEAIERLSTVDSGSASAAGAARLLDEIQDKRKAFHRRLQEAQAQMERAVAEREARSTALLAAQQASTGTDPEAAHRQYQAAATAAGCHEEERHQRGHKPEPEAK